MTEDQTIRMIDDVSKREGDRMERMLESAFNHQLEILKLLPEGDRMPMLVAQQGLICDMVIQISADINDIFATIIHEASKD